MGSILLGHVDSTFCKTRSSVSAASPKEMNEDPSASGRLPGYTSKPLNRVGLGGLGRFCQFEVQALVDVGQKRCAFVHVLLGNMSHCTII